MLEITKTTLRATETKLIRDFGNEIASLGVNFFVCDTELNLIQHCDGQGFVSDFESVTDAAKRVLEADSSDIKVSSLLVSELKISDSTVAVILIDTGRDSDEKSVEYLQLLLKMFVRNFVMDYKGQQQVELISNELAQTYEELMLLYKMSSNMKVSQSDSNYLQIACDNLTDLVNVEGIAIFLEKDTHHGRKLVMTAGTGLIAIAHKGDGMQEILYERLIAELETGADVLLDSEVYSPFKYDWSGRVENIIAVPLRANGKVIGMMVATNRIDKPDFDSIDAKLFNSVANQCATFIENNGLFSDLKELFIGSLQALTNSIDAKDPYTRGHSERVAFISKWIAEHYAQEHELKLDEIQRIYIAGMLHDIGKIGIIESVLCKNGKLTNDEYDMIKKHPEIGAGILSDIKQMADIVPGVLCHHEWHNGNGYPNRLIGEDIPLVGKIVMIADTFDAMTSKRTYRDALSVDTAIEEIRNGLGEQFDPEIGRVFIESDIEKLWEILQNGRVDDYYNSSFNDYGTVAVGALLR